MSSAKELAKKFKESCENQGWDYFVRGSILSITKSIRSREDFVKADSEYYFLLGIAPTTSPGSIWGTDGSGVGALSAMKSGLFVMNKSGVSKRFLSALMKS